MSFDSYLSEVAPFKTEVEAGAFLEKRGISVYRTGHINANVDALRLLIGDGFSRSGRPRNSIRIEHDAKMIGSLLARGTGARPFFVTADRRLVSVLVDSPYRAVMSNVLFPHQAFSLAQVAGRSRGMVRGLARTIFSVGRDGSRQLREFYIDRVLAEYEPALLDDLPSIVEAITNEVEVARELVRLVPDDDDDSSDRARRFIQLDQFESMFHERMLEAKRRRGIVE